MEKLFMNGQEVKLKSPGTKGLKDFLIVQQAVGKVFDEIDISGTSRSEIEKDLESKNINFLKYFSDKEFDALTRLVDLSLKKTFPDYTDEVDEWAMKNSMTIMTNVLELCQPDNMTDDQSRAERLKEAMNKNA